MAALVLFGGGGDLAMRMLLPSLYFLERDSLLPDGLKIIAAARSEETVPEFVARTREAVETRARADGGWDPASWDRLAARLDYLAVDATDADGLQAAKSRSVATSTPSSRSTRPYAAPSPRSASSASTTISARKQSRT